MSILSLTFQLPPKDFPGFQHTTTASLEGTRLQTLVFALASWAVLPVLALRERPHMSSDERSGKLSNQMCQLPSRNRFCRMPVGFRPDPSLNDITAFHPPPGAQDVVRASFPGPKFAWMLDNKDLCVPTRS